MARSARRVQKRNDSETVSLQLKLGTIATPTDNCPVISDLQSRSWSQGLIFQTVVTDNVNTKSRDAAVKTIMSCDDITSTDNDSRARLLEPGDIGLTVYSRKWDDHECFSTLVYHP